MLSQGSNDVVPAAQMKKSKSYDLDFLVGEDGFGPSKSLTTDLQSAPFGHSGIPPL